MRELPPLGLRHWLLILIVPSAVAAAVFARHEALPLPSPSEAMLVGTLGERGDDYAVMAAKSAGARLTEADAIILGSSAPREALWEDPALTAACREAGGQRCDVLSLVCSAQTFVEALFLLDEAPLRQGQTVLIFTAPSSFAWRLHDALWRMRRGLFLKPPIQFAERHQEALPELASMTRFPRRGLLSYRVTQLLVYRNMFLSLRNPAMRWLYGYAPRPATRYWYAKDRPGDLARIRGFDEQVQRRMDRGFAAAHDFHERALRQLIRHVRARGGRVVLMESPRPSFAGTPAAWLPEYEAILARMQREEGVAYVDLNRTVALRAEDFVDARHTSAAGRDTWSRALTAWWARHAL